jgi:hypothetical protein
MTGGRGRSKRSKKTKGKSAWKGFILLVLYVVSMGVLFKVMLPMAQQTSVPEISSADKATMQRAEDTQGGKLLKSAGYVTDSVISEPLIVAFLDEQEKHAGITNAGPYVTFITPDRPIVQYPLDRVNADQVVDVASGVIVALQQSFKAPDAHSGRGAICYAANMDDLARGWPILNKANGYLRGKSLPLQVPVSRDLVPELPEKFAPTSCYVYPS